MQAYINGGFEYTVQVGDTLWLIAQRFHTTTEAILLENPMLDGNNLYIGQIIRIPQSSRYNPMTSRCFSNCISREEQMLSNQFRLLWEQHVYWTRMVILSIVFGLPDIEYVTNRLLRNPKDFARLLGLFYGEDVVSNFVNLFTKHLTIAAELVKASKDGDNAAAANAEKRWYANADQIAEFFARINPYWSEQTWKKLLYDHLAMTKDEAIYMLTQKYADSINIFDKIEQEALIMADTMTQGIVKLFPHYMCIFD